LLCSYQKSGSQDWLQYKKTNPYSYSRNLIYISCNLEVILLVWGKGQVSPIHDHNKSNCWFVVMDGIIQESQYSYTMNGDKADLTQLGTNIFSKGDCVAVKDDSILHKVNGPGVTLHLYNRPIYRCNIYCPFTGTVEKRKPGFYSIFGNVDADCSIYKNFYERLEAFDNGTLSELPPMSPAYEISTPQEEMSTFEEIVIVDNETSEIAILELGSPSSLKKSVEMEATQREDSPQKLKHTNSSSFLELVEDQHYSKIATNYL